jgi:putative transposase
VIWTLPDGDADFALCWRLIKTEFSRALPSRESVSQSRSRKGERGIWQRRYWEHTLRNEADFERHFNYIHFNPVKHGYVSRVSDWPFSSFHRMVQLGVLSDDWAGDARDGGVEFGER